MIRIADYIKDFPIASHQDKAPWQITQSLVAILEDMIPLMGNEFVVSGGNAIHKSAILEPGVIIKPPVIICAGVFIAAGAYLRGGVYLADSVTIGPGCEIKTSIICVDSHIAHFNFVGDSLIGSHVNFEAGALTANYHNDKPDKRIYAIHNSIIIDTGVDKFGALVGDDSKIGANAVLAPGTLLPKNKIVNRLQLIDQINNR